MRDELDPPGEQLELPWEDAPVLEAHLVETLVHRVHWSATSWSCACGAGYTWPGKVTGAGQPRAGAVRHMRAVAKRIRHGP